MVHAVLRGRDGARSPERSGMVHAVLRGRAGARSPEREGCKHLAVRSSARVTLGSELRSALSTGLS